MKNQLTTNPHAIRAARVAKGLTPTQAGERAGLGRGSSAARAWEAMEAHPTAKITLETITRLGLLLGVNEFGLVTGWSNESKSVAATAPDLLAALKTLSEIGSDFTDKVADPEKLFTILVGDDVLGCNDSVVVNNVGLAIEAAQKSLLALLSNAINVYGNTVSKFQH